VIDQVLSICVPREEWIKSHPPLQK